MEPHRPSGNLMLPGQPALVRNAPSWTWRMPVAGRPVSPGVSLSAPSQSSLASVFELSNSREIVGVILVPFGPTPWSKLVPPCTPAGVRW